MDCELYHGLSTQMRDQVPRRKTNFEIKRSHLDTDRQRVTPPYPSCIISLTIKSQESGLLVEVVAPPTAIGGILLKIDRPFTRPLLRTKHEKVDL